MAGIDPGTYEAWFEKPLGGFADRAEKRLISKAVTSLPGGRVLDAGCGTGHFTSLFLKPGVEVIGFDLSLDMLAYARHRYSVLEVVQGNVEALPFQAGSFDTIVMLTVLEFVDRPEAALAETMRALRPSGRFVVGFLDRLSPWGLVRRVRGRLGSAFWRKVRLYSGYEMVQLLTRAGYCLVARQSALLGSYTVFVGEKRSPA
jgi:SAM-dependent methyltransferase